MIELAGEELAASRARVRSELWEALPEECRSGVHSCLPRLVAALPRPGLAANTVLVAFGGGKDSAYTIAFVRAIQLELFAQRGETFRMRVVTNRHSGMPRAVLENVGRTFAALMIEADPDCEPLLVDGNVVRPFRVDEPLPPELVERNRLDILMAGHRTLADGRPTFCNACNLSFANSLGLSAAFDGGADVLVTGDSPEEQRAYGAWIRRLGKRLEVERQSPDFAGLLSTLDQIGTTYFEEIHGQGVEMDERRVASGTPPEMRFFSIYDDTKYASGDHWALLTGFLGFVFDPLAFSFTESDCANPALMAHLRGLKSERLYERTYDEGLTEYVRFALALMRSKSFPEKLIETMADRYRGPDNEMRAAMEDYGSTTFGLSDEQLVCMVYSPFVGAGERLRRFLAREHPSLAGEVTAVEALLSGDQDDGEPELVAALEALSGLTLAQLRTLYASPSPPLTGIGRGQGAVGVILEDDPHKAVIATRHEPTGPLIDELISGR